MPGTIKDKGVTTALPRVLLLVLSEVVTHSGP